MGSVNLAGELAAAAGMVRQPHLDRLWSLGVPKWFIAERGERLPPIGVAHVEASRGGLYQPLPGAGTSCLILPVIEDGDLIDLVAFRSTSPDDWLLRTGNGFALGLEDGMGRWLWYAPADLDAKPPKHEVGRPTHLFANPLDWMQGGGAGVSVLDWSSPEIHRLDVLPRVTVSDQATAALLDHALRRPVRVPQIDVIGGLANVA
jgi:hypothetical protein